MIYGILSIGKVIKYLCFNMYQHDAKTYIDINHT